MGGFEGSGVGFTDGDREDREGLTLGMFEHVSQHTSAAMSATVRHSSNMSEQDSASATP